MTRATIDRLIINSPYEEPQRYWRYDRQTRTFELVAGRRPAGYVVASGDSRAFDAPGIFVEIPLVNQIRPRVKAWREAGYMSRVVQHVWEAVRQENTEKLVPVFDRDHPIRSTGDMRTWYTSKPCERTRKSHINVCVYDSAWEASDAFVLDDSDAVAAWVKNDHLGFEVFYVYGGVVRKYRPDFLVRLRSGHMLVLETKGQDTEQDKVKRQYLEEWVQAVNAYGGFGRWRWAVARQPGEIRDLILQGEEARTVG